MFLRIAFVCSLAMLKAYFTPAAAPSDCARGSLIVAEIQVSKARAPIG